MIKPDEGKRSEVTKGLSDLFNRMGIDSAMETPDYVLADVAYRAVLAFGEASEERDKHSMKVPTTVDWHRSPRKREQEGFEMGLTEVTSWKTSDGTIIENKGEAEEYERRWLVKRGLETVMEWYDWIVRRIFSNEELE